MSEKTEVKKTDNVLEVKDLSVIYKTDDRIVYAVNNINFAIKEREAIGLVGETGAGKTTTALTIMRLLPERTGKVTNGEVLLNGEEPARLPQGPHAYGPRRADLHDLPGSHERPEPGYLRR